MSSIVGLAMGWLFGLLWWLAGASTVSPAKRLPTVAAGLLITILFAAMLYRSPTLEPGAQPAFRGAIYGLAVGLEVVGIAVAVNVLRLRGRLDLLPAVVTIVVGLHFIGLWKASGAPVFLWVSVGLCSIGAAAILRYPQIEDGPVRLTFTGIGSACVLWASCLLTVIRGH